MKAETRFIRRLMVSVAVFGLALTLEACSTQEDDPVSLEELFADKTMPTVGATAPSRGSFTPSGDSTACARVDAPMVDIAAFSPSEPGLRLPQPAGWARMTQLDSELVRFTLVNRSLVANQFAPNIVVGVEQSPAKEATSVYAQAEENIIELAGGTDLTAESVTVCGLPAQKLTYKAAGMGGAQAAERYLETLHVLTTSGDVPYLVSATVQTTAPQDPTYRRDAELMLNGFQVLAPAAAS